MASLKLLMNEKLFLKDPQDTDLGRKIVGESIMLIDEMGIEGFTFKKLAVKIDSTEASIYRYFENKHKMLVYLITWYWNWLEYRIDFETHNINDPVERLKKAIQIVGEKKEYDPSFANVNEEALSRIVIAESDKTYLTKQVDADNNDGLFRGFKSLCRKIACFVSAVNPDFKFPHALVSTMLQTAHQQIFFAKHLPSLTELKGDDAEVNEQNVNFMTLLVLNTINA